ncbi:TPA: hypothetical protein ACOVJJ_004437 [Klebsiella oxytoca]
MKKKKTICILLFILFFSGCSEDKSNKKSQSNCAEHAEKIICNWDNATDNWNKAKPGDLD